ncbi:hypothetical protein ABT56_14210 [Photobacterium aquae]|uniref:Uncharacterized protein n=1 Tax=Photobacterium aquae TaxID=1195763 RepID=A0A0J1GYQ0_9GAMM|nr:hypothetical protein [Photobacterium aquae]KLV04614.1 hypothetical protein ABT56_14210 [Photobacterium aquae]
MSSSDTPVSIFVDPLSPDSIAQALAEYRQCLSDGSAFRRRMGLQFNIQFLHLSGRPLKAEDAGDNRGMLQRALSACRSDERETNIGEPILFAAALSFPELLPELERTAQAMVNFARSRNDSGDMWLDDYNVFGIEALYMLALVEPAYTFYLSGFIVPYWDGETLRQPLFLFGKLVERYGWSRDVIKAYVWSDGMHLRRYFFMDGEGTQLQCDLLAHFTAHPQDYQWFKSQLVERLGQRPLLASPGGEAEHPVLSFYYSLADWDVDAEIWQEGEWQDQVKQQLLLGLRIEDEALALLAEVKQAYPGVALSRMAPAWQLEDRYQDWPLPDAADPCCDDEEWGIDQWDEDDWEECYYPLHPSRDKLRVTVFEDLDDELEEAGTQWLTHLPAHLGGCAYAAWRLHSSKTASSEHGAILDWLEATLPELLLQQMLYYGDFSDSEEQRVQHWLTDASSDDDEQALFALLRDNLYHDGGTRGEWISASQPAYQLWLFNDGGQRAFLSLYWLLQYRQKTGQERPLFVLAERHWQLVVALAPLRVINRIFYCWSDYAHYAAINDVEGESQLARELIGLGIPEAMIEATLIVTDQQVAGYRPADARFWQRYCARVEAFAQAGCAETGMDPVDSHQSVPPQALFAQASFAALQKAYPQQLLALFAHIKAVAPQANLPIDDYFSAALQASLEKRLAAGIAVKVKDQLLDYLATGEGLEALSPQALGLPQLQGWEPHYGSTAGHAAPAEFVWLLPPSQGERLARFFAQLGKRGLHWLGCSYVEEAYANSRVASGEIPLTERWSHSEVGYLRHSNPSVGMALLMAKDHWALSWLDSIGVGECELTHYAVNQGRDQHAFVCKLAGEGRLPDMQEWLTADERVRLLYMLKQGELACYQASLEIMSQDSSAEVRQMAESLLEQ